MWPFRFPMTIGYPGLTPATRYGYSRGMSEMTRETLGQRVSRLWTDSIAYVALLVSAGLSLAGNVVDTFRVRGPETDTLDIWLAITWPGLVVLMVHLFVSGRWLGLRWHFQVLRWVGCLGIMGMAMVGSWLHLNELLVSRDQPAILAVGGPLAIDGLAIMATALILAGRGRQAPTGPGLLATLDTALDKAMATSGMSKSAYVATEDDVRQSEEAFAAGVQDMSSESIWERLDNEVSTEASTLPVPVSPAPAVAKLDKIPSDALDMLHAWFTADVDNRPAGADVDKLMAGHLGVSTRTARRWREAFRVHRDSIGA
jgi:hypothetical protein